jgi:hypothetical protein
MPVAGPGKFAKRTDQPVREVTGLPYGDGQAILAQQGAAPMAAAEAPADAPAPAPLPLAPGAPSQRPSEPVTAGAALGPGAGPDGLFAGRFGRPAGAGDVSRAINTIAASDPSGVLARLAIEAQRRGL